MTGSSSVAFFTVGRHPADAVRFPGEITQLAPLGEGQAIADKWNAEHLSGLVREHQERWNSTANDDPATDSAADNDQPGASAGVDERDEAEAERLLREADDTWMARRDAAFAGGGEDFSKVTWLNRNPRPTLEAVYEQTFGRPYPRQAIVPIFSRPPSRPKVPDPPQGAHVEQIESAWCIRFDGVGIDNDEEVLSEVGPLPRLEIARRLTEVLSAGWTIVNWSDERVVIHDEHTSRTEPAGLSIVLQRT
jgi:hypothetical protein